MLGGHPVEELDAHGLAVGLDPLPSPGLGLVHGRGGVGHQRRGVVDPEGVEGQSHRGVEEDLRTRHHEGHGQGPPGPVGEGPGAGVGTTVGAQEQGQELVADRPGHQHGVPRHALEPFGHRDEHGVPGHLAQAGVDGLEPLEVEEEHGDGAGGGVRTRQHLGQALLEPVTAGQARERVHPGPRLGRVIHR